MNVHAIAEIAKGYCLKNSGKLRDDIVSECESILESFDTIEKGILPRDISLLPVYSINVASNPSGKNSLYCLINSL